MLGRGVVLTLVGITVGVATAYVLLRFVLGMLFGVSPHDALTFSSVPFALLAVAVAASLIPAPRASRVDPMEVLREQRGGSEGRGPPARIKYECGEHAPDVRVPQEVFA